MAATVQYITKTFNRAVIKVVGTASGDTATITIGAPGGTPFLDDLTVTGQTVSAAPTVTISAIAYSVHASGDATIVRNAVPIFKLFGNGVMPYGSNEQASKNIVVTFTTTLGGTVIIELSKTDGYSAINPPGVQ